jgi:hypothetical protein
MPASFRMPVMLFRPEAVLPWLGAESAQMLHGAGSIPILSFTADAIR